MLCYTHIFCLRAVGSKSSGNKMTHLLILDQQVRLLVLQVVYTKYIVQSGDMVKQNRLFDLTVRFCKLLSIWMILCLNCFWNMALCLHLVWAFTILPSNDGKILYTLLMLFFTIDQHETNYFIAWNYIHRLLDVRQSLY